jgi:two-component system, NarL family, response regulator DegU
LTTIVIADDHPIILKGLVTLFQVEHEFHIVDAATSGSDAIQKVELHKPDVLVLDLMLPDLNGLQVLQRVIDISPDTRVLILSMHSDRAYVTEAFKRGALGYVIKSSAPDALVIAARRVAAGERFLDGSIADEDIDSYLKRAEDSRLAVGEA